MQNYSSWNRVSVRKKAEISLTEKKSVFIGICAPLGLNDPQKEAENLLTAIKEAHPDARHVVHAFQTVKPYASSGLSDDGEPKGTAGMPVSEVLRKNDIDQAIIAVVRYFGGILLGAGGLRRAYSSAAAEALRAAEPVDIIRLPKYKLRLPYDFAESFLNEAAKIEGVEADVPEYGEFVETAFAVKDQALERFVSTAQSFFKSEIELEAVGYKEIMQSRIK